MSSIAQAASSPLLRDVSNKERLAIIGSQKTHPIPIDIAIMPSLACNVAELESTKELLIGKDFWNFICQSDDGYKKKSE